MNKPIEIQQGKIYIFKDNRSSVYKWKIIEITATTYFIKNMDRENVEFRTTIYDFNNKYTPIEIIEDIQNPFKFELQVYIKELPLDVKIPKKKNKLNEI